MGAEETNHSQYIQAISSTVVLNKASMEKLSKKHPERILRVDYTRGVDKKATHLWKR